MAERYLTFASSCVKIASVYGLPPFFSCTNTGKEIIVESWAWYLFLLWIWIQGFYLLGFESVPVTRPFFLYPDPDLGKEISENNNVNISNFKTIISKLKNFFRSNCIPSWTFFKTIGYPLIVRLLPVKYRYRKSCADVNGFLSSGQRPASILRETEQTRTAIKLRWEL